MDRRALVLGHFSTVGDLECLSQVRAWLTQAGLDCDVAPYSAKIRAELTGSLDPSSVDPAAYGHLIVVCGPCWGQHFHDRGIRIERFDHCVRIGVNLTMVAPLSEWDPFDVLLERDSDRTSRPDLAFLSDPAGAKAVVGRCVIDKQPEYGGRQRHEAAIAAIDGLLQRSEVAVVDLDTRWARPGVRLRDPAAFAAVLGRCDVLVTNRLHGLVFALRGGIPVIAVDGIQGGDKLLAQARAIGWPMATTVDLATPEWMSSALAWCRSGEARTAARMSRDRARAGLAGMAAAFGEALASSPKPRPTRAPAGLVDRFLSRLSVKREGP